VKFSTDIGEYGNGSVNNNGSKCLSSAFIFNLCHIKAFRLRNIKYMYATHIHSDPLPHTMELLGIDVAIISLHHKLHHNCFITTIVIGDIMIIFFVSRGCWPTFNARRMRTSILVLGT
jgi:hypothetical protein